MRRILLAISALLVVSPAFAEPELLPGLQGFEALLTRVKLCKEKSFENSPICTPEEVKWTNAMIEVCGSNKDPDGCANYAFATHFAEKHKSDKEPSRVIIHRGDQSTI